MLLYSFYKTLEREDVSFNTNIEEIEGFEEEIGILASDMVEELHYIIGNNLYHIHYYTFVYFMFFFRYITKILTGDCIMMLDKGKYQVFEVDIEFNELDNRIFSSITKKVFSMEFKKKRLITYIKKRSMEDFFSIVTRLPCFDSFSLSLYKRKSVLLSMKI